MQKQVVHDGESSTQDENNRRAILTKAYFVAASPSSAFSFLLVIDFCFYEVNNILIV
jgi:hypothetical protein